METDLNKENFLIVTVPWVPLNTYKIRSEIEKDGKTWVLIQVESLADKTRLGYAEKVSYTKRITAPCLQCDNGKDQCWMDDDKVNGCLKLYY